jgi:general secretion pathway protein D
MFRFQSRSLFKQSLTICCISLITLVSGCSTPKGPSYQVEVNSAGVPEIVSYNEKGEKIADGSGAKSLDAYYKYGNEKIVNSSPKKSFSKKEGEYSLDFVNIAIEEFLSIVFNEMLSKNYILDSSIKGEITVQTKGRVNADQLLSIVESVLASKNAVMVSKDNHYEFIPLNKAKNYSLKPELYSARNLEAGYRMVIIPINYLNPDDLKPILDSVAPEAGHLKIDKERRAVVMTGTAQEIANVVDTIQIFDVNWLESKSVALLPVNNTEASTVLKEINKILTSQNKNHGIVIDTFDRFNALLVVANTRKEVDAVKNWLDVLDVAVPTADTQLFVYEVQNRKASELADMLNNIFSDSPAGIVSSSTTDKSNTVSNNEVVVTNKAATATPAARRSASRSTTSDLKIVADETNNAILILAKKSEYDSIKKVMKELDTLPLQVLIEVSIVEVTLTDELSYGLEWFLKKNGISGGKYDASSTLDLNSGSGIGAISPGFSFLLSGTGSLVSAVFNTLASESKLNVISSPSLMALDNHTATIRVGDQQPVQVSAGKSTNNDVLTQSIEYKSTGVLLSVTPRVNSGGLVTMELSQEVTDVGSIDDATGQRSFLQRNINSTVAVQNGRTIILGGLITENASNGESGIPGLHSVPYAGGLFGKTTNSKIKRELIVLITPKVIFNHQDALDITQEYAEKMELLKSSLDVKQ